MPSGQGDDQSRAYALTTVNATKVVGENKSINHGLRWKTTDSLWQGDDLNDMIDPNDGWTIVSAHDINDYYYIVAVATKQVNNQTEWHLVLLVPNVSNP